MAAFVTVLLCSGLIGVQKVSEIPAFEILGSNFGPFRFGSAILFFPFSYIFGDILTEVYGYARARRVVWAGFAALFFAALMSRIVPRDSTCTYVVGSSGVRDGVRIYMAHCRRQLAGLLGR
jgi:uncharacterized PurR-regulated membrane protein YhhQ (DUF165 family)